MGTADRTDRRACGTTYGTLRGWLRCTACGPASSVGRGVASVVALVAVLIAAQASMGCATATATATATGTGTGTTAGQAPRSLGLSLDAEGPPAAAPGEARPGGAPGAWSTASGPAAPVQSLGRRDPDDHGPRYATVVLGERRVDDDWEPLDEQPVVGIIFDETDAATGHGIEVGLTYAEDDDSAIDPVFGLGPADVEVETMEFYVGWRRTFRQAEQGLHPYVSAGATGVRTSVDVTAGGLHEKESDMEPGVYVRAGLLWDIGPTVRCGLDYRYVLVDEHTLGGMEIDGDFDQVLLTFGWAF